MKRRVFTLALPACGLLAGCAALRPAGAPLLRLSPGSLGGELAVQEQMTVTGFGRSQQLEAALEVDAASVRLALLLFGQPLARLAWDGHTLQESRLPGWPAAISADRVLSDLQLVHWPAAAVRDALPVGWMLDEGAGTRTLRHGATDVVRVRYPATGQAVLENLPSGYRVHISAASGSTS